MSQPPTVEGLIALLERKKLEKEAEALKNGRTSFDEWMKFTKEELKRYHQLNGIAIYNYLHSTAVPVPGTPMAISPSSFITHKLPWIHFADRTTKSNSYVSSTIANPRDPEIVREWTDFVSGANSFAFSDEVESMQVSRPSFVDFRNLSGSEKEVHAAVITNVTRILSKFLATISDLPFEFTTEIHANFKGNPDHLIYKTINEKDIDYSFIEHKTIHDVPTPTGQNSLVQWWQTDVVDEYAERKPARLRKSIYNEICQVYGYLLFNSLKYGVLTTYQSTWFFRRPAVGILEISPRIACDQEYPTLLRCYVYFLSLIEQGHLIKRTESYPAFPRKETVSSYETKHDYNTRSNTNKSQISEDFELDKLGEAIGIGASGSVYRWTYKGRDVVVKVCDTSNNRDGYDMIKNEVKAYELLADIQGIFIPKIHFHRKISQFFVICMDFIEGNHFNPRARNPKVDQQLHEIVENLKLHGVKHKDIEHRNILVDGNGKVWLIDFGICDSETRS
jgi:predicted Ser/Thr protein kinase